MALSLIIGSRIRSVLVVLVLVGLVVGGAFAAGVLGVPSVADVENRFGPVDETTTVVETDLTVSNPNPVGASLSGLTVDYNVLLNDVSLANGTKSGVDVGSGNSTLEFSTAARNERIPPWWVTHIRNDEQTAVTVDTSVQSSLLGRTVDPPNVTRQVETDLLSEFNSTETREVNADQPLVSDPVLYVNETSAEWETVTDERTPMDLTFVVYNPKSYPVAVSQLEYNITMNGVAVGGGQTESEYVIPPKSTATIEATAAIRNDRIDEWWVTHLERNQVTDLRIDFAARLELSETTVRVPLDPLTYTTVIETDIFGTKPEAATDGNESSGGNGTATPTPTTEGDNDSTPDGGGDSAGTTTPTSAPTATPTPTPTPTPDDETTTDGGLIGLE